MDRRRYRVSTKVAHHTGCYHYLIIKSREITGAGENVEHIHVGLPYDLAVG